MKATFIFFLGASQIATGEASQPPKIVSLGPAGVCPPAPVVTIELQPVYCRALISDDRVREASLDDQNVAVSGYSTTTCISTIFTRTISDLSSGALSTGTIIASSPTSPTIVPPYISAELVATSTIASPPISSSDLYIDEGLPSGTISDLPDSQFFFLGFSGLSSPTPVAVNRAKLRRQELSITASALTLVDLSRPTDIPGGLDQDYCDQSSPLLLRSGTLLQADRAVEKISGEMNPMLGFLSSPHANPVNTTFTLTDGILQWTTSDTGSATFYNCHGILYASFEGGMSGCVQVVLFAIAGSACIERVQRTRQPDPVFVAPLFVVSSSTVAAIPTVASSSPMSSSSGRVGNLLSMAAMTDDISSAPSASTSITSDNMNISSTTNIASSAPIVPPSNMDTVSNLNLANNDHPTTVSLSSVPPLVNGSTPASGNSPATSLSSSEPSFVLSPTLFGGHSASLSQPSTISSTVAISTTSSPIAIFSTRTSATPNLSLATSSIEVSSSEISSTTLLSAATSFTETLSIATPSLTSISPTVSTDATLYTTSIVISGTSTSNTTPSSSSSSSPPPPIGHTGDCPIATNPYPAPGLCGCGYLYHCDQLAIFPGEAFLYGYSLEGDEYNHMDQCAMGCDIENDCRAFSVIKETQFCQLFSADPDTVAGASGYDYGSRNPTAWCIKPLCEI